MVVIKGRGTSKVGEESRRMLTFGSANALEDVWCVIGKGVPHEFFPEREAIFWRVAGPFLRQTGPGRNMNYVKTEVAYRF
jgi:hypothetical protein